ncbi:methyltransferase domain-containing protein [Subsaximicrobium wynnwilliamsii]|uniref:Methyltransferase domain-containing protein n=1 Tax=Subsaximicrobium wynnwilliamsii TaxID=291179 RepID=A0A5C6ZJ47_9FLAO|nr:methyltransferase domain-containing protein [Subsaximicrobium wynnwilliamsii]TXD83515.1 methyltransferase domain-containing protein [Subsaximicrobium wynnwilliamsii]TXD89210.1 methyltransferase domain-containing protein [Subsaximicrobium wynnwilliamsii]TXE03195.1 methyltransferase domain-containing protein [Subsaximicrobium wynnwilliamsii]
MLNDKITADYSKIVSSHELDAEAQRANACPAIFNSIRHRYPTFKGCIAEADLGLGCALPFEHANLKEGDLVADLGCAAGIDSFIMADLAGTKSQVFGFYITPSLIKRANAIKNNFGIEQVQFATADITEIPLEDDSVSVCTSNGVFSLIKDLEAVFKEIKRILRPGGVFCLSDINRKTNFSEVDYAQIKSYTGCLNGIRHQNSYLDHIKNAGFSSVELIGERLVEFPNHISKTQGVYISTFKITL